MDFLITMGYFVVHCDGLETAVDFCWTRSRQMESHGRLWCRERTAWEARSWLSSPWKNKCPCLYSLCLSLSLSIHPSSYLAICLSIYIYIWIYIKIHIYIYIYAYIFLSPTVTIEFAAHICIYIYVCAWHYVLWYMGRFDIKYLAYIHSCA